MKKLLTGAIFAVFPPLSIILTTPFASLSEHIGHILLFAFFGLLMGGYILRNDLTKANQFRKGFIPSFTTIIFMLLLLFAVTHSMPCPYMFSPQTAQTMIDHPCSQPTTPGIATISFIPIIMMLGTIVFSFPVLTVVIPVQTTDPRSPPLS